MTDLPVMAAARLSSQRNSGGMMRHLQQTLHGILRPGERSGYVAECVEIAVVTQGKTIDATLKNLQKAVALHLEGEDPAQFGLRAQPTLSVTMELEPVHA